MDFQLAATLQALLEGVPLPAGRARLLDYARAQGAEERELAALRRLPDRAYRSLDEVGEELAPVQPRPAPERKAPHSESGEPPGGEDYLRIPTDTGRVRE
jgi:Protein of unknown function (DUF2795)